MSPARKRNRKLLRESREINDAIRKEDLDFHHELDRKPTGRFPSLWPRLDIPDENR